MMKFIRKHSDNKYRIVKCYRVKGKQIQKHFGIFDDLNQARAYRDLCVENNWDEKLMPKNSPFLTQPLKYIHKTNTGNYRILKQRNGKIIDYGSFRTLFDAIQERDLLYECDWDYDAVCNIDETIVGMPIFNGMRCDENG